LFERSLGKTRTRNELVNNECLDYIKKYNIDRLYSQHMIHQIATTAFTLISSVTLRDDI